MKSSRLILYVLVIAAVGGIVCFSTVTGSIRTTAPSASWTVVPEYELGLQHVVLSIESRGGHLDAYEGLLTHLPGSTRVSVLVPENHLERVRDRFQSFSPRCRVEWIPFSENLAEANGHAYLLFPEKQKLLDTGPIEDIKRFQGSAWAQDLFEAAVDRRGKPVLLIPEVHKWFICPDGRDPYRVVSDNRFLEVLRPQGFILHQTPLTFRGGNILVDRLQGKLVAFCGGDVFRLTRTVWRATRDRVPSVVELKDKLKQTLGVDEVVVIGGDSVQPEYLFHLDQAMAFLGDGLVAVTLIVQEHGNLPSRAAISEARSFLTDLRKTLRKRGYRIVDMETPARDLIGHRYPVNGIPFTEVGTENRAFLMPIYSYPEDHDSMQHIEKNRKALQRNGYRVVLVPTTADRNYGGIHCLAHVVQ